MRLTKLQKAEIQERVENGINFLRKIAKKNRKIKNAILKIRTNKLDLEKPISDVKSCGCVLSELSFHMNEAWSTFQRGCDIIKIDGIQNIGKLGFDFKGDDDEARFSGYSVLTKPWKLELPKLQKELSKI